MKALLAAGSLYRSSGSSTWNTRTFSVENPGFEPLSRREGTDEDARSREHHQRKSHFRNHEALRQKPSSRARARPATLVKRAREVGAGRREGRRNAERKPRENRCGDREEEHALVQPGGKRRGHLAAKRECEETDSPVGENGTEGSCHKSENEALKKELPEDTPSRRTHGGSHRELFLSIHPPSEIEVRDVGARDEKNEQEGALKKYHELSVSSARELLPHR